MVHNYYIGELFNACLCGLYICFLCPFGSLVSLLFCNVSLQAFLYHYEI